MATGVGALPLLFFNRPPQRAQNALLGFAAGVMLAASFFSLIIPALEAAGAATASKAWGAGLVIAAILLGAAALHVLNRLAPHEHFVAGHHGAHTPAIGRVWLFVIAITIHNLPEGLAVGVSYASGDYGQGAAMATGIGLQNMPEGLAVAAALGPFYGPWRSVGLALATGLVEPLGAALGLSALSGSALLLPWGLGFAAGAMIWVVSSEIIPETHRGETQGASTAALMLGLAAMLFLDVTFG